MNKIKSSSSSCVSQMSCAQWRSIQQCVYMWHHENKNKKKNKNLLENLTTREFIKRIKYFYIIFCAYTKLWSLQKKKKNRKWEREREKKLPFYSHIELNWVAHNRISYD